LTHSTGTTASEAICPRGSKLGAFEGNVVHSNAKNGIYIGEVLAPRE